MVNYASCLHATYIANNIRIIIILFLGRFHLQMNKTSVRSLYLYAFLFTLSAWLCDVTFTANRSCTLVGCGWTPLSQRREEARLILFYKIINGLAQVPFEGVLVEAYKGTRRKHNMKFRQIGHITSQYGQSFVSKNY